MGFLTFIINLINKNKNTFSFSINNKVLSLSILIVLVFLLGGRVNKAFSLDSGNHAIHDVLSKSEKPILSGVYVHSFNNFNIMGFNRNTYMLSNRPENTINFYINDEIHVLHLNCTNFKNAISLKDQYIIQSQCFSKRKKETWNFIAKKLNVNYIIVNKALTNLQLPIIISTKDFTVYNLEN